MKKLEIVNPDGSLYWTEYFNNLEMAEKWINEEKTRPYWNHEFTYSIFDFGMPEKTPEEIAIELAIREQKRADRYKRIIDLKAINWADINTIAELRAIVKSLVEEIED